MQNFLPPEWVENKRVRTDHGVTLIETMVAVMVALLGVFSLGAVVFQATVTNKNQGTETTRAVIYAQDKLEKLLSLDYANCTQAASSQPSSCNTTGISDFGWTQGLLAGGPIVSTGTTTGPDALTCGTVASATQGYIDFLDVNGQQLPSGTVAGACSSVTVTSISYVREWSITDLTSFTGGPTMKKITVAVYSTLGLSATMAGKPIVLVTSVRSNPN